LENKFTFIKNITQNNFHSGGSFWEHLYNTGLLLWKMGEPKYVCDAGLYHAVYDTYYYKAGLNVNRSQVKSLIGEKAENLVYIFCNLEDRRNSLLNKYDLPKDIHINLLKIEYANIIEQNRKPDNKEKIIKNINYKIVKLSQT
tara:strand:+ start:77 stop:505 length:429 start_codon:yes stop_codon:yes gene_type:complete